MKKILLSFLFMVSIHSLFGQETKFTEPYRQLLITEARLDIQETAYLELTNVGDQAVNLSDIYLAHARWSYPAHQPEIVFDTVAGRFSNIYWPNIAPQDGGAWLWQGPDHMLNPGESYVICNVYDGMVGPDNTELNTNLGIFEKADHYIHWNEGDDDEDVLNSYYPEYENYDFDSVSVSHRLLWTGHSSSYTVIHRYYDEEGIVVDSAAVDVINLVLNEANSHIIETLPIAGVEDAVEDHIIIRKSSIDEGNINWDESRGASAEDSEWITIPNFPGEAYTTIGTHGNFTLSYQSDILTFDDNNNTLTVPWGTQKGDSIIHDMVIEDGMAWQYFEDTLSVEDSLHTICQDGDILKLYAAGDILQTKSFVIEVMDPATDMAEVFPVRNFNYAVAADTSIQGSVWGGVRYYVTEDDPDIDTIGDVPFATRVDTLLKYLEKAPAANWEIVFVDGTDRVDLKNGDILRVTAENGSTTKDYFIDVQDYTLSDNAQLSAITWPDRPGYLDPQVWDHQDTIPRFSRNTFLYTVRLPYETKSVPVLHATPANMNAEVKIESATNLSGDIQDRTTNITVTAQSDTVERVYQVIFERELPDILTQPFESEPIISEILCRQRFWNSALEIANPGNQPLDLSQYMIGISRRGGITPATFIEDIIPTLEDQNYTNRYMQERVYIPGYKWPATRELYDLNPGIMEFDPVVNPIVEPKDVFVMGSTDWNDPPNRLTPSFDEYDVCLSQYKNTWDEEINVRSMFNFLSSTDNMYIFKITNDSILLGTKAIGDPADFKLVEYWGKADNDNVWNIAGRELASNGRYHIIRKPHFFTPGTEYERGWGTTADSSDWIVNTVGDEYQGININHDALSFNIGRHTLDPITAYMSTVVSSVYEVDDGYVSPLFIEGISNGEDVEAFLGNIIPADTGQSLKVLSNVDGSEKASDAAITDNDTLWVMSADSVNITKYALKTTPLDDDAVLVADDNSNIQISIDGETGTITGFNYNVTLRALLDSITVPELATLNIRDKDGQRVPLKMLNNDTVYVDTKVGPGMVFEVVAQNSFTINYTLQPNEGLNNAYVLSNVYEVDQELSFISLIDYGTEVNRFMSMLMPAEGATVTLYDKADMVRENGEVRFDDYLVVEAADGENSKVYFLDFLEEPEGSNAYILSDIFDIDQAQKTINELPRNVNVTELINGITLAPAATAVVRDVDGNEVTSGYPTDGAYIEVTSGNGQQTVNYSILFTEKLLATVTSDVYTINTDNLDIAEVPAGTSVEDFLTNLTPYTQATMQVVDANLDPVSSGEIMEDYQLVVTSGDEVETNTYTISLITSVNGMNTSTLSIYPNPVSERLYINNLPEQANIKVINVLGEVVLLTKSPNAKAGLDVSELPQGLYIMSVDTDEKVTLMRFVKEK